MDNESKAGLIMSLKDENEYLLQQNQMWKTRLNSEVERNGIENQTITRDIRDL